MDRLTIGILGRFHSLGVGDGHLHRRRGLQGFPVQQEPDIKEPGEHHGIRLSRCLHGGGGLAQVGLIFLGIPGDLRNLQHHALRQLRVGAVAHRDRVVRPLKGQLREDLLLHRDQAIVRMDMLFQGAIAPAGPGMDMTGLAAVEGLLRQLAVAKNHGIVLLIGHILHPVGGIALDGDELRRFLTGSRDQLRHQTHMVRQAVQLPVIEDQITGYRSIVRRRGAVPVQRLQVRDPGPAAPVQRHSLHIRVVDAEGDEHGAPVSVGTAVPVAVAGIAMLGAILPDSVISRTFGITQLGFGDGQDILPPVAGETHIREGLLPLLPGLHIRFRIGVAGGGMGMLLLLTDQQPGAVAKLRVPVAFSLLQMAGQVSFLIIAFRAVGVGALPLRDPAGEGFGIRGHLHRLKAGVGMLMGQDLGPAADQASAFVITVCGMLMEDDLLPSAAQHRLRRLRFHRLVRQAADQGLGPLVAFVGVLVGRLLRHAADDFPGNGIAPVAMVVAGGFLQRAGKLAVFIIAAFSMAVSVPFLLTAGQIPGLRIAFLRVQVQRLRGLGADQLSPLPGIARLRMDVGRLRLGNGIAVLTVDMGADLRQSAAQVSVAVITGRIMVVQHNIRLRECRVFPIAHQHPLLLSGHPDVALHRVGMLLHPAEGGFLQRNGRQNQGIDRAEHHHTGHAGHHPVPASPFSSGVGKFSSVLQYIHRIIHRPLHSHAPEPGSTRSGIQIYQSPRAAGRIRQKSAAKGQPGAPVCPVPALQHTSALQKTLRRPYCIPCGSLREIKFPFFETFPRICKNIEYYVNTQPPKNQVVFPQKIGKIVEKCSHSATV